MYATMIVFGILPSLAIGISMGVKEFPEELKNKAYTLGVSDAEAICNAVVKYVLPRMIEQIKLSIGPAMVYLIAAELLVGDVGMGYRIRILSRRLEMQVVYPYLVFLAAFGFLIDAALGWLKRLLCPWHKEGG
jgi:NitT/TauT family transport system permease protein